MRLRSRAGTWVRESGFGGVDGDEHGGDCQHRPEEEEAEEEEGGTGGRRVLHEIESHFYEQDEQDEEEEEEEEQEAAADTDTDADTDKTTSEQGPCATTLRCANILRRALHNPTVAVAQSQIHYTDEDGMVSTLIEHMEDDPVDVRTINPSREYHESETKSIWTRLQTNIIEAISEVQFNLAYDKLDAMPTTRVPRLIREAIERCGLYYIRCEEQQLTIGNLMTISRGGTRCESLDVQCNERQCHRAGRNACISR